MFWLADTLISSSSSNWGSKENSIFLISACIRTPSSESCASIAADLSSARVTSIVSFRIRLADLMALPAREADPTLTVLRPKKAPRMAVPKEMAV